jgi:KDO2-lipid IV(A) lauroyltransferase
MSFVKLVKFAPFYLLSLLPFWIIFRISYFAYFILFVVFGYRKKVVYQNLKNSFPNKSEVEIHLDAKSFYKHFCEVFLESVKLLTIPSKQIKKRYSFKNPDLLEKFYNQKKSLIIYAAHFGNWEWMTSLQLQTKYQMYSFYQKQSNGYFNDFMIHVRERFGNLCIESQSGFKVLLQNTKQKNLTITYVVGDQSPMSNSTMHWTNFLNQDTAFLVGADRMAKKCNQQLIYPHITQDKKGYYEIEFKVIAMGSDIEPIEIYANLLQKNIEEQPELWLWSHRRWKRKRNLTTN